MKSDHTLDIRCVDEVSPLFNHMVRYFKRRTRLHIARVLILSIY
jgi:hypothetical protein